MSDPFALAGVTAVLRARLDGRLTLADVQAAIGPITVTSIPPDQVQSGGSEPNQLNVWLHHADTSAAWRNVDHPVRESSGRRTRRPPLVLDLRYLITAFGVDTYAAEILLGHTLAELHERPLLDLASIDGVLHPTVADPTLPDAVGSSGLELQCEPVRITPVAVASEEMSRLWQSLGAQYRATAAYEVGPVMIDPVELGATALPVLNPQASPTPFVPIAIADIVLAPAPDEPVDPLAPISATSEVLVRGANVAAADRAIIGGQEVPIVRRLPIGPVFDLATTPGLQPGPATIQLLQGAVSQSNVALVEVRPSAVAAVTADEIRLTMAPPVGANQRVVLLLNEFDAAPDTEPRAIALEAAPRNGAAADDDTSDTVPFDRTDVPAATYVFRVQVDGVASELTVDGGLRFDGPQVVVP